MISSIREAKKYNLPIIREARFFAVTKEAIYVLSHDWETQKLDEGWAELFEKQTAHQKQKKKQRTKAKNTTKSRK